MRDLPFMRVTDAEGDVFLYLGHDPQEAYDAFGDNIQIEYFWGINEEDMQLLELSK